MCRESDGVIWASLALAPRGYPPRLPGLGACRSFVVDKAADALAHAVEIAGFVPCAHPSAWREPASSGDTLPSPAQRERWVASPPVSRISVTMANAPMDAMP